MFSLLTSFIVLIERRRLPRRLLAALTAFAVAAAGLTPLTVHARQAAPGYDRAHKVAHDLNGELDDAAAPRHRWSRHVGGVKTVQVVIVSDSDDAQMSDLRAQVER